MDKISCIIVLPPEVRLWVITDTEVRVNGVLLSPEEAEKVRSIANAAMEAIKDGSLPALSFPIGTKNTTT
jgi:hypothetical protein